MASSFFTELPVGFFFSPGEGWRGERNFGFDSAQYESINSTQIFTWNVSVFGVSASLVPPPHLFDHYNLFEHFSSQSMAESGFSHQYRRVLKQSLLEHSKVAALAALAAAAAAAAAVQRQQHSIRRTISSVLFPSITHYLWNALSGPLLFINKSVKRKFGARKYRTTNTITVKSRKLRLYIIGQGLRENGADDDGRKKLVKNQVLLKTNFSTNMIVIRHNGRFEQFGGFIYYTTPQTQVQRV